MREDREFKSSLVVYGVWGQFRRWPLHPIPPNGRKINTEYSVVLLYRSLIISQTFLQKQSFHSCTYAPAWVLTSDICIMKFWTTELSSSPEDSASLANRRFPYNRMVVMSQLTSLGKIFLSTWVSNSCGRTSAFGSKVAASRLFCIYSLWFYTLAHVTQKDSVMHCRILKCKGLYKCKTYSFTVCLGRPTSELDLLKGFCSKWFRVLFIQVCWG